MKYPLVIFDFDGTLADSLPWFLRVVNDVADRHEFKRVREEELETLRAYDAGRMLAHAGVPLWKTPIIASDVHRMMAEQIDQIQLFAGVNEMLKALVAQGRTLALVSSNSAENVRRVLGPRNVELFHHYECGTSMFGKKTKFLKVLRHAKRLASDAICIGDEIRDSEAARGARIAFGAVAWGYTKVASLQEYLPEVVFTKVDEIAEVLP